jgi:hypothetical protein
MKRPTANTVPYGYRNLLFRKGVSKALLITGATKIANASCALI